MDDSKSNEHFENLNSMNWQTVRLKPPPPGQETIGWRVEVRPCEISLTDFENAAYTSLSVLLSAAAARGETDWRVPISELDANMSKAHALDAVKQQQLTWRGPTGLGLQSLHAITQELVAVASAELERAALSEDEQEVIQRYLAWISSVGSGKIETTAMWIRRFVTTHPAYQRDSVVGSEIAYDLLRACEGVTVGARSEKICWKLRDGDCSRNPSIRDALLSPHGESREVCMVGCC